MKKKPLKICVCLVNNYSSFSKTFTISLLQMLTYFYEWERKAERSDLISVIVQPGYNLDWMRNEVTRVAINAGQDYLLFLDIDMDFPQDTIPRMLMVLETNEKHGFNAVTGIYTHKNPPYMPLIYAYFDKKTTSYAGVGGGFPMDKPFPVEAAGCGIMMIKAEVVKNTPEPWFKFAKEGEIPELPKGLGEDLYFCWKCKPKMLCDPKIICGHYAEKPATIQDFVSYNKLKMEGGKIKVSQKRLNDIKNKHEHERVMKAVDNAEKLVSR
jgi:hypothetical protein